jgi:hypothetical protein
MPDRFYIRSVSGSRNGVALLLVLAFIVLLTILIVSFISFSRLNRMSTASYSQTIQAQEIAQGGIEDILNDFHQEIVAGSTLQNGGSTSYAPVYIPTTNWTAQPARLGYNPAFYGADVTSINLPPTLVRVSRASQDSVQTDLYPPLSATYYPGTLPLNRASKANTSTHSINGRNVSAGRWNKIALLATNNVIAPAFSTNTPDWVYVTRSGSQALTATSPNIKPSSSLITTTAVVGRYAYAVYDEGALLDVNAAGYVSSATNSYAVTPPTPIYTDPTTGISQIIAGKTYTSYADFTQLPGFTGAQTAVDSLIQWRNASVTLTGSSGGVNFYKAAFTNAKTGFKTFSAGDSPILGRQDLINYFAQIDPTGTSYAAALPFLGTFTRAGNAPSSNPPADSENLPGYVGPSYSGGTYNGIATVGYKSNAESSTTTLFSEPDAMTTTAIAFPNPNRDVPNVRYASAGSITHYADDGTTATYTVQAGDPVVQHRFSLTKLAWLTYSGPNTAIPKATAQAIQDCFGLKWTSNPEGYSCWQYVAGHQEGTPSQLSIETLDEVAAEHREPNFFEMLKAAILAGSLGQTPGPLIGGESGTGTWTANSTEGIPGSGFVTYSGERDRQILQIGANLIDQSDADSYPTDIYMALFSVGSQGDDLSFNNVYGDENLPMLSRVVPIFVGIPSTSYKLWFQPEIWNPHQAFGVSTTPSTVPQKFAMQAYGAVQLQVNNGRGSFSNSGTLYYDRSDSPVLKPPSSTYSYTDQTGKVVSANGQDLALVYFSDAKTGTVASSFYNNPIRLDSTYPYNNGFSPNALSFSGFPTVPVNLWGELGYIITLPTDYNNSGSSATPSGPLKSNTSNTFAGILAGECDGVDFTMSKWSSTNANYNLYCTIAPFPAPLTFSLDYEDAAGALHPYNFMSRIKDQAETFEYTVTGGIPYPNYGSGGPVQGQTWYATILTWSLVDPRTDRLSCVDTTCGGNGRWRMDSTADPGLTNIPAVQGNASDCLGAAGIQGSDETFPDRSYGFVYSPNPPTIVPWEASNLLMGFWSVNQPSSLTANAYYIDPDGVVRPGDAYRRNPATTDTNGNYSSSTTGDGSLFWNASDATTSLAPPPSRGTLAAATTSTALGSVQARRSVVLNRPFRSVGEMGYACRDVPFKTLDFFSKESGDAALLDFFCVEDEPATSAGQVNLSNAPASVINAILKGASKMDINNPVSDATGFPNFMTSADASAVSSAIETYVSQNGPLLNRSELVTKLSDPIYAKLYSTSVGNGSAAGCANYANKAYAEAPVRALSSVASTRTWNLVIDIIAQSGFLAPSGSTLNDFVVAGERRYWLHVSIDRYTGKIIDQQLEPVYE